MERREEVFKTRTRIIDDRMTPVKADLGSIKDLITRELTAFTPPSLELGLNSDLNKLLKSSSQVFVLPEVEAKYLNQYKLDSDLLLTLTEKVDHLTRKTKDIKRFIRDRIIDEDAERLKYVVAIQAWFRGIKCREYLKTRNHKIFGRRIYKDMDLANRAAVKIQAIWRGTVTRYRLGGEHFQIEIMRLVVAEQGRKIRALKEQLKLGKIEAIDELKIRMDKQQRQIDELLAR